jgi:hypothetical protein
VGEDLAKAHALGNALLVCMIVPWFLCFVFYTGERVHYSDPFALLYVNTKWRPTLLALEAS